VSEKQSANWKDEDMSLIQEALRRQQEEMQASEKIGRGESPEPAAPKPPAPNPILLKSKAASSAEEAPQKILEETDTLQDEQEMDDPDEEPRETPAPLRRQSSEKTHSVFGPILITLIVLLLLGGAVVWAAMMGFRLFSRQKEDSAHIAPPPAPVAEAQQPVVVDPVAPETEETAASTDAILDGAEADPSEEPGSTQPRDTQESTVAVVQTPVLPPPMAPQPPPEPVIWPEIYVSGVMGAGTTGSAIINGKVYGVNDRIGEVAIVDFGRGFVILAYKGETRRFPVGRTVR
jgi:hypothetical protein